MLNLLYFEAVAEQAKYLIPTRLQIKKLKILTAALYLFVNLRMYNYMCEYVFE